MVDRLRFPALIFLAYCLFVAPLSAQEARGTIQGTVTDAQKAVMPGATVTLTNSDTNTPRTVTTSMIGYYEAPFLDAGTYTIVCEMPGFKRHSRPGVVLNV